MARTRTNRKIRKGTRNTQVIAEQLASLLGIEFSDYPPCDCAKLPTVVGNSFIFEEFTPDGEVEDYRIYHIVAHMIDAKQIGLQKYPDGKIQRIWLVNANNEIVYVFWSEDIAAKTYNQFCRMLDKHDWVLDVL